MEVTRLHSYLKAIGFSDITDKKKLDQILKEVIHTYDEKIVVEDGKHHLFAELSKMFGCDFWDYSVWGIR